MPIVIRENFFELPVIEKYCISFRFYIAVDYCVSIGWIPHR